MAKTNDKQTEKQPRKDVCVIQIMFPVTEWDDAIARCGKLKAVVADMDDVDVSMRLGTPMIRPGMGLGRG